MTRKNFCLSLYGANSYLLVNGTENIRVKGKDAIPLYLGNILKEFSADNMKKTRFYGYVNDFSVDYDAIAIDDILNIHKYLMKKNGIA